MSYHTSVEMDDIVNYYDTLIVPPSDKTTKVERMLLWYLANKNYTFWPRQMLNEKL